MVPRRFPVKTPALWAPKTLVAHQYDPESLLAASPAFCFFLLITYVQPLSSNSDPTPISSDFWRPEAAFKSRQPVKCARNANQLSIQQRIDMEAEVLHSDLPLILGMSYFKTVRSECLRVSSTMLLHHHDLGCVPVLNGTIGPLAPGPHSLQGCEDPGP